MHTLTVDLADRTYPIHIGKQLIGNSTLLAERIRGQQVYVVTNETIAPLYLDAVLSSVQGYQVDTTILPDGEQHSRHERTYPHIVPVNFRVRQHPKNQGEKSSDDCKGNREIQHLQQPWR